MINYPIMISDDGLQQLKGSGGYIIAHLTDEQQAKANLGGPDLFLAPIGRLESEKISVYFCNTCSKKFEGPPKIEFERPVEQVADNLILAEKGRYVCGLCSSVISEYKNFRKTDETKEIGAAKPLVQHAEQSVDGPTLDGASNLEHDVPDSQASSPTTSRSPHKSTLPDSAVDTPSDPPVPIGPVDGKIVYDEYATRIGVAKHVGIDPSIESTVLMITKDDGADEIIAWNRVKIIGEIIILGMPTEDTTYNTTAASVPLGDLPKQNDTQSTMEQCYECNFSNVSDAKFCEKCGAQLIASKSSTISDMSIMDASDSDIALILNLLYDLGRPRPRDDHEADIFRRKVKKYISDPDMGIFVVKLNDIKIIGIASIMLLHRLNYEARELYLTELVVLEKYQKHGAGTALINYCMAFAKEHGCNRIRLESANFRKGAHEFYTRLDFDKSAAFFEKALD